ncbi:Bug family tripartite tricarboxylate transporter substrate binding protein [Variovorax soli]|uniref:Bug family tripartite tricarboxylate transporter substrate binding protein n=1 Tax=Variovorax soli TaxID=376815 RepID=UPI0008381063|nr:tripartite tricarboxylate transporter substrate binding protein [Variovorax soli]
MRRPFRSFLLSATVLLASQAHAWPDQPLTLVVPYTPGTGIDLIARQLSAQLPRTLGQPVIVDNVPGASGNIGSERVARAKPDGYTLMVQVNTLVMNKSLYKSLAYDPVADFTPVALTSWGSLLLVTNPTVQKAKTLADMVAEAKAAPGKLTYATPGVGTPHHMSMALLAQSSGIDLLHVPYKGTAGAVTDLLGGRIDFMFLPVHVALQHIQAGKLRALATGSPRRLPQLPDVPTLAEAGAKVDNVDMWYGVLAPKGTSPDVVRRLNREIAAVLKQPEVAKAFESQGMVPATATPDEFGALIKKDAARWAEVVRRGNITAE